MKTGKTYHLGDSFTLVEHDEPMHRKFVCYWFTSGFTHISLGFHFDFILPNIEIHLPFGFIRVGWVWEFDELVKREEI